MPNLERGPLGGLALILAGAIAGPVAIFLAFAPMEQRLDGRARVIDGDTLQINGQRVRLLGLDAPEVGQLCTKMTGEVFDCGAKSAYELETFIGKRGLNCRGKKYDSYGRLLASCTVEGQDLGQFLVLRGWAVTYGDSAYRYTSDERMAKAERAGLWATYFDMPWLWRRR